LAITVPLLIIFKIVLFILRPFIFILKSFFNNYRY